MPQLTAEQRRNIRRALRVAQAQGATPRERKALVEAMGVESNYRHLNYGDRDSVGVLQQRPSMGWGPAGETVEQDVRQFLAAARKANTVGGSAGQLAQRVQRSAFPDRYDQRSGEAEQILARYGGGGSQAPQRRSQPTPAPTYTTHTTPGVDNSGLRRQLVGDFLQQGGIKNPDAVLGLAAQYGQAADVPGTTMRVRNPAATPRRSTAPSPATPLPKSGENNWGVVERAGRSGLYLQQKYGIKDVGGYRANDPYPDHPSRKALDLMVYEDTRKGSRIARELTRDYKRHGVKYIIWNQRIWHPGEGWRKMPDRGSPTQNHKDHVHVLYE